MSWINRHEELLKAQSINYLRVGDRLLREYNKIIIPLGPVITPSANLPVDAKKVLKKLHGFLVWWTDNQEVDTSPWYAVIKDKYLEVDEYHSSNMRNKIRKGLKNCEIRQVEASWLGEHGYSVFKNALYTFTKNKIPGLAAFKKKIEPTFNFSDIIHYWGIFMDEKLVGYSVVYCYENHEANISEIRINPDYNTYRPSYALLHKLSEFYLKNQKFNYVNNGYRNLLHETNIQQLLLSDFGYRKLKVKLHRAYRFPFGIMVKTINPFKNRLTRFESISAVLQLEDVYKKKLP